MNAATRLRARRLIPLGLLLLSLTAPLAAQIRWDSWWADHQAEYLWGFEPWSLHRPSASDRPRPQTGPISGNTSSPGAGAADVAAGRTPSIERPDTLRRGFAYGQVVPVLLDLAENADDPRLRAAAVSSLGKVVQPRYARLISDSLRARLDDMSNAVRAAAIFALGEAYDPEHGVDLIELARDTTAGRRLVGSERVPNAQRGAAITALGQAQDEQLVPELIALYHSFPEKDTGFRSGALSALALNAGQRSPQVADFLHALLADNWLDRGLRARIPTALIYLHERSSIPVLLELIDDPDLDPGLRASTLEALGELASAIDEEAVQALVEFAFEDKDPSTRRLALMSAVRVLGRDPVMNAHTPSHLLFVRTLGRQMRYPRHRNDGSFHALAAGTYLRTHLSLGQSLFDVLEYDIIDLKDPVHRGAYAIALALSGAEGVGELLHELFIDNKDEVFRAYCGEALGLMRYQPAAETLLAIYDDEGRSPGFLSKIGTALTLMGDPNIAELALTELVESGSFDKRQGLIGALGNQRDEGVVLRLLELVVDERLDLLDRASICRLIGRLAAWRPLPLLKDFSIGRPPPQQRAPEASLQQLAAS